MNEDIKKDCLLRWDALNEDVINSFSFHFDEWMSQFPEELKSTIQAFLKNYEYYSHQRMNSYAIPYYMAMHSQVNFNDQDAVFSPLKFRTDRTDSSTMFSAEFMFENGLDLQNWCQNESQQKNLFKRAKIIVMVDDICGSGKTFNDFLDRNSELLKGKELFYIVHHFMEGSRTNIETKAEKLGIRFHIITKGSYYKAFSVINRDHQVTFDKTKFCDFSTSVGICENRVLGFENTEALVSFYHDTPNDTLGIFWFTSEKYKPIFPRRDTKEKRNQFEEMKEGERKRQNSSYLSKQKRN